MANDEMLYTLHRIELKLGEIVTLLKMSQAGSIEATKEKMLESPLRKAVYSLCDGKNTVSDISKGLGKSMSLISQVMSKLQEVGLVTEERKGKLRIYRRLV
jgi:DNA-binding transcriptional ArsR family regulator